jgi:hypothetical protein
MTVLKNVRPVEEGVTCSGYPEATCNRDNFRLDGFSIEISKRVVRTEEKSL